jgi:hypothetical protein
VSCEDDDEPSGSIKGGEFLDQLRVLLASRRTAPWSYIKEGKCGFKLHISARKNKL